MPCTRSRSFFSSTQCRLSPSVVSGSYHLGSPSSSPHPSTSSSQEQSVKESDQFSQPFIHNAESDDTMVHCPFKIFEECQDGVH